MEGSRAAVLVWVCLVVGLHGIPVSVMLSLTTVNNDGTLNQPEQLRADLERLRSGGVNGVMGDVWWGIVEKSVQQYDFTAYLELAEMVKELGLTFQPILSFHRCGGNVGDTCTIPLPQWVLDAATEQDLFYVDQNGVPDTEYLSLSADTAAVFPSNDTSVLRTGRDLYADFAAEFSRVFAPYFPQTINTIQIGLGPAGEMRYPGYQSDRWTYCGVGAFQCYDPRMLANLSAAATAVGHPEWGNGGPSNAGDYNSCPFNTPFWTSGNFDNFESAYGKFFLGWYSDMLLYSHAEPILASMSTIFSPSQVRLSAKVAGIHWWYGSDSHGSEVTSGYVNTNLEDAYLTIGEMFSRVNTTFDFTALELLDGTQYGQCGSYKNNKCGSLPEELVDQTLLAAQKADVLYEGENALPIINESGLGNQQAFDQIYYKSTKYYPIHRFTFLRISDNMLYNEANWAMFTDFVNRMAQA
mmetsp:Transcript_29003/g.81135  ORF Transcript_29003/g.81135 Transcript_29003/m.81135 type:complete len:467 (+) Transcript_29003:61-1461(+)|eukprot:CAMPEP_0119119188 /NCGR_PEP_ID=MMETSP1310-20130426/784_1 /TAXON_ID=464262 /ORGANISM="Genus nov. species nov., Strain RCC2339" /LENGTH=466 /DNA_ID=CAMNT_0007108607 /DNA_START=37 /DNA_END=1437 /DNA_ORIENTATION=-